MKTPGLTGAVLGVAAVFGISWIAAIACWRLGSRVPGPAEIAGAMLGMPGALAGVLAWWRRREPAAPVDPAPCSDVEHEHPESAPPLTRLAIRAAALELPSGSDPAEVLARLAAGAGLSLHPQLRDPRGFGVLAAEVAGLDTCAVEAQLATLDPEATPVRPELARALALAEPVLERLLATCGTAPGACGLLLPTHWSGCERELGRRWLGQRLAEAGLERPPQTATFAVASGGELLRRLRTPPTTTDERPRGPWLWLATSSNVGSGSVNRWARHGRLLGAGAPEGRAPGEAAAGVVLDACAQGDETACLHLPDIGRPPAGASPDACLAARMGEALSMGGLDPTGIGLVASDVDHRRSPCASLATATSTHVPHLDPTRSVLRLSQACGHADAAPALAAIALCAHATSASGLSSVVVGSDDRLGPTLALVTPHDTSP